MHCKSTSGFQTKWPPLALYPNPKMKTRSSPRLCMSFAIKLLKNFESWYFVGSINEVIEFSRNLFLSKHTFHCFISMYDACFWKAVINYLGRLLHLACLHRFLWTWNKTTLVSDKARETSTAEVKEKITGRMFPKFYHNSHRFTWKLFKLQISITGTSTINIKIE